MSAFFSAMTNLVLIYERVTSSASTALKDNFLTNAHWLNSPELK
jgi:hypothetical protein